MTIGPILTLVMEYAYMVRDQLDREFRLTKELHHAKDL